MEPQNRCGFHLAECRVCPGGRYVSGLHAHIVALRRLAEALLDCINEVQKPDFFGIADVHNAKRRNRRQAVAFGYFSVCRALWNGIDQKADPSHQIINMCEIAVHVAVIVYVDRPVIEDRVNEFEQGEVGPAPCAVDGEKPEHGGGEVVEVGIGMRHALIGLLGRRIHRQLSVGLVGFAKRHGRICAIH